MFFLLSSALPLLPFSPQHPLLTPIVLYDSLLSPHQLSSPVLFPALCFPVFLRALSSPYHSYTFLGARCKYKGTKNVLKGVIKIEIRI